MADVFDRMLKEGESLFVNELALDFSFRPKNIQFRENEQHALADTFKPLLQKRTARNLLITGKPGIGKTLAVRDVLDQIEERTDEVRPVYVNCWHRNSSYKVALELCEQLDYPLTHNKRTDELLKMCVREANKKSAVFVFDEIDKVEDYDFLYMILEEVFRKSVVLITNYDDWLAQLDERIRSRLMPEAIEFKRYNGKEIEGIMHTRMGAAFVEGIWDAEAFERVVESTVEVGDIRFGLTLMRNTGLAAEDRSSRKIEMRDVEQALTKATDYKEKEIKSLEKEEQTILALAKAHSGTRIGELFKHYQEKGGVVNYKAFQRKVRKLGEDRFISTEKVVGGKDGTTTIIRYADKKLTEF
ncbi:MAG: AAA family ATPase [archaeon]